MKHYDALIVDRLDRLYIKLSVKTFMLDDNEGPNQLIIEPSEHIRTDEYVKVHASIDTDKRIIIVKGPHEYLKHEFIYPEGTTHFVYDEFISENIYRIRRPVPLKIEDDMSLSCRLDGKWVRAEKSGPRRFNDDEIKSVDQILEDQKNPRLRNKHPFHCLFDMYAKSSEESDSYDICEPYKPAPEEIRYSKFEHCLVTFNLEMMGLYQKDFYALTELKLSFNDFINEVQKIKHGKIIATNMASCKFFKLAYEKVIV